MNVSSLLCVCVAVGSAMLGTSCTILTTGGSSSKLARVADMPPDYDAPRSQFVEADFAKLASEFADEYMGQYITFEARYLQHREGYKSLDSFGGPSRTPGMMQATFLAPAPAGLDASRHVVVSWSTEDRELGRPMLEVKSLAPVRVFAFMLPANVRSRLKSRDDIYFPGASVGRLLLIRVEPN